MAKDKATSAPSSQVAPPRPPPRRSFAMPQPEATPSPPSCRRTHTGGGDRPRGQGQGRPHSLPPPRSGSARTHARLLPRARAPRSSPCQMPPETHCCQVTRARPSLSTPLPPPTHTHRQEEGGSGKAKGKTAVAPPPSVWVQQHTSAPPPRACPAEIAVPLTRPPTSPPAHTPRRRAGVCRGSLPREGCLRSLLPGMGSGTHARPSLPALAPCGTRCPSDAAQARYAYLNCFRKKWSPG